MTSETPTRTRREENRLNTMAEIIERGGAHVDEHGADQLSLNAIAREMRVSGPALYRYVATRDELLTLIAIDGYQRLRRSLTDALRGAARRRTPARMLALGSAYRDWALTHPHRYRLMFADPRGTGGEPQTRAAVQAAAGPAMEVLTTALGDSAADPGRIALRAWLRMHGVVSLEIAGALDSMELDAAQLMEAELRLAVVDG